MEATLVQFYLPENTRHRGELAYEWLLEHAKSLAVPGGTVFRGIAGFGRSGTLEQTSFLELTPNLPVVVQFVCDDTQADALINLVRAERLNLFFTRTVARVGWTDQPLP
jgi:PII-like signaling protein